MDYCRYRTSPIYHGRIRQSTNARTYEDGPQTVRSKPPKQPVNSSGLVSERYPARSTKGEIVNQAGESAGQSQCLAGAEIDLLTRRVSVD